MRASTIVFGLVASFTVAAPLASLNGRSDATGILGSALGSTLGSIVGTGSGNKASADGNSATGNGNGNGNGNAAANGNGNGNKASADGNTLGSDFGNINVGLPPVTVDPSIDVPITLRTR